MSTRCAFGDGSLRAVVKATGAELCSLQDEAGREYLWQAGAAWPRHAPLLFPIVGRLAGDVLRHDGQAYPLTQHGFARDLEWQWLAQESDGCRLLLADSAATRARYPFGFRLEMAYRIADGALHMQATLHNPGTTPLPASFGFHPAFAWPLPGAAGKPGHVLEFASEEPAPVARLAGGLLRRGAEPSPVQGRVLPLDEALFAADALVMEAPRSTQLRYAAPGARTLELAWDGLPQLGLWMKPGADFLCIEPWCGFASPVGWDGDVAQKPGVVLVPPGGQRAFSMRVGLA